jgi:tRNA-Thr(GGU) m(6)t(6)A37 methyltransferase TsaA
MAGDGEFALRPIGVVRSAIQDMRAMPAEGVDAEIEVYEPFRGGLAAAGANSHLIVLGWFDRADRETLLAGNPASPRGVFGLRSPARPNPIGLAICRLITLTDRGPRVANLDFVDGTPIVDLKRYSPSWDSIFSARSSRDQRPATVDDGQIDEAIREAAAFHGTACPTLIAGSRLILAVAAAWSRPRKADSLTIHVSSDGCLADTLQALTGATIGSGRLHWSNGPASRIAAGSESCRFVRRSWDALDRDHARSAPLESLFAFLDPVPW